MYFIHFFRFMFYKVAGIALLLRLPHDSLRLDVRLDIQRDLVDVVPCTLRAFFLLFAQRRVDHHAGHLFVHPQDLFVLYLLLPLAALLLLKGTLFLHGNPALHSALPPVSGVLHRTLVHLAPLLRHSLNKGLVCQNHQTDHRDHKDRQHCPHDTKQLIRSVSERPGNDPSSVMCLAAAQIDLLDLIRLRPRKVSSEQFTDHADDDKQDPSCH